MFKRCKYLFLVFSAFILLVFESTDISKAEEFVDGKYFASVIGSSKVRWNIIVEKSGSSLKVINLNSESYQSENFLIGKLEAVEWNEKLGTLELDEDLEYDSDWVSYIRVNGGWNNGLQKFRFYGTLGKFSKTQMTLIDKIEESRFKYVPFRFYDSFQKALLLYPNLTTKNFEKTIYAQNVDE